MTRRVMRIALAGAMMLCACGDDDDDRSSPDAAVSDRAALFARLSAAPLPSFDVDAALDRFEYFVTTYVDRVQGSPQNELASVFLERRLLAAGYEVRVLVYEPDTSPVRVVQGIKPGVDDPQRYTGIISHYDVVAATSQGAYDNGSGVAVALTLCELLAKVDTRKSIACVFFDGEEGGRLGSRAYVEQFVTAAPDDQPFVFEQVFGFDMVGLNWPGHDTWKLHAMLGLDTPELQPQLPTHSVLLAAVVRDFLELPEQGVELHDVHFRNSDENTFKAAGVPAIRFAGGRNAFDYPAWHGADDTVDTVYELAGGREAFAAGYELAVRVAYYLVLAYDGFDALALPDLGM